MIQQSVVAAAVATQNPLVAEAASDAISISTTTTVADATAEEDASSQLLLQKDCANGVLAAEQAVPGAYENACMYLPIRPIPVYKNRISSSSGSDPIVTLQIRQQAPAAIAGSTGLAVWNSSLLLCRLLEALVDNSNDSKSNASSFWKQHPTCVELGCGTGVASLAAAALGATHVVATDGNPSVVQLAAQNVQVNQAAIMALSTNSNADSTQIIETKVLPWGLMDALDLADTANLVIGSDLTYNPAGWPLLAESMSTILKPQQQRGRPSKMTTPQQQQESSSSTTSPLILYLSLGHAGFNVNPEVDGFLAVASSRGLQVVPPADPDYPFAVNPQQWLLQTCQTTTERALLQQSGGVRVVVLRHVAK